MWLDELEYMDEIYLISVPILVNSGDGAGAAEGVEKEIEEMAS